MTHHVLYPLIFSMSAATAARAAAVPRRTKLGRLHRSLSKVLKGEVATEIAACGRAVGFHHSRRMLAVTWDDGAWCLLYRVDELLGVELLVDGRPVMRAFRNERRAACKVGGRARMQVNLRLLFADKAYPEFVLELWNVTRVAPGAPDSSEAAILEGTRWFAGIEALLPGKPPAPGPTKPPVIVWRGEARFGRGLGAQFPATPVRAAGASSEPAASRTWRAQSVWRLNSRRDVVGQGAWPNAVSPRWRASEAPPDAPIRLT